VSHAESASGRRFILATVAVLLVGLICLLLATRALAVPAPAITSVGVPGFDHVSVEGTVKPNTGNPVAWVYEVSTDGGQSWQQTNLSGGIPDTSDTPHAANGEITELQAGTTFQLRLSAHEQNFGTGYSPEPNPEFTTQAVAPPTVEIKPVGAVTATTAIFAGHIDTNTPPDESSLFDVQWHFECTPECPGLEGTITAAEGEADVEVEAKGLVPNTDYEVSLVAQNAGAPVSDGPIAFKTDQIPAPTVKIDPVTAITARTAHFSGLIKPNSPGVGDPAASDVRWHFQCEPECPGLSDEEIVSNGTAEEVVEVDAAGLEPHTTYKVTLIGKNAGEPVTAGPVEFTTDEVAPSVQTIPAFVLEGGTSALLGARVNPHNSATKYWFELEGPIGGTVAIPASEDAAAGNGGVAQFVSQKALNLSPGTTYHFHVVATSAGGTTDGNNVAFTTPTPAPAEGECSNKQFRVGPSAPLPDCRAFELVSAPDLGGHSVLHPFTNLAVFKQEFPAVSQDGNAAIWATDGIRPETDSDGNWDNYLSRRTSAGWHSEYVSPPASKRAAEPFIAFAEPTSFNRLVWDVASESIDPTDPDIGLVSPPTSSGGTNSSSYRDLLRREPDGQFVRFTKGPAEERAEGQSIFYAPPLFSQDAMHTTFSWAGPKLTADAEPGAAYVSDGQTTMPINDAFPEEIRPQAISDDGGTVVYQPLFGKYLKILTDGLTRTITVAEVESVGGGGFKVWHLSGDGQSLLYSSGLQETSDDSDNSSDLYEYDVATETKHRISAPTGAPTGPNSGNNDNCPGSWRGDCNPDVVAVSSDGSGVYFVSPELLDGALGVAGEPNLYYRAGGVTTYVGSLVSGDDTGPFDGRDPTGGPAGLGANAAQMTPDGSKLIFQSKARLTGYDNHEMNEIYLYDPANGELTCASCRLNGSQPAGQTELRLRDPQFEFRAPLKPLSIVASDESGEHIFFATYDSLRPGDTDQKPDVYSTDLQHGTISALGNLTADQDNYFWGASDDGRDVFMLSTSRLNDEERSVGAYKLWDARIGGGFAAPLPPPGETCEGDPCHGPGSAAPEASGSGTSKFEGPGNPPVKQKKKRKHHKKHHKRKEHHKHGKGKKHAAKHRADDKRRNH
jgi:hypothetical protein